jgi:hypothetical protein
MVPDLPSDAPSLPSWKTINSRTARWSFLLSYGSIWEAWNASRKRRISTGERVTIRERTREPTEDWYGGQHLRPEAAAIEARRGQSATCLLPLEWRESYHLTIISLIGLNDIIRGSGNDDSASVLNWVCGPVWQNLLFRPREFPCID